MSPTVLFSNPTPDRYGASRVLLESVIAFRDAGWRVVVTTPSVGPLVDDVTALGATVEVCASPTLRKRYRSVRGLAILACETVRAVPKGVRLLRRIRPDLLYVNTITQPLWLVLARGLRVPTMLHVHEAEAGASPLMRKALAAPLLLASSLVANSRFSVGVLRSSVRSLERRCTVIYNGVPGPPSVTQPRPSLDGPVRLVYVGRLSERKGVADVVDAVGVLADHGVVAHLDVVGDAYPGYGWVEEDLHARSTRRGTDGRIEFHGFQPEVWPYLERADIVVVPSRVDEPFGNTAVEAALAARPLITTGVGGLVEATEGRRAALVVPPGDPEAIARAVIDVIGRWEEMRAAAVDDAVAVERRFAPAEYRARVLAAAEAVVVAAPDTNAA